MRAETLATTAHLTEDARARSAFRRALLRWFDRHRRPLPWRRDRHPYRVWVSEIMLQQTRVAAVLEHYARFLQRFPTVEALARAPEEAVLAAWSGLGYYRRARSLHAAARQLVQEHQARSKTSSAAQPDNLFPACAAAWQALPGIGRYTAAAIASICFSERCAVVDGNVERVLERIFGPGRDPWPIAGALLSPARPGDFNQAMMELGALVCLPAKPLCPECPVSRWCPRSQASGAVIPSAARPRSRRRRQQLNYLLVRRGTRILLERRGDREPLMPGMWELPAVPDAPAGSAILSLRHSILDTDYRVHLFPAAPAASARATARPAARWFSRPQALALPLTGLARKILLRVESR
jgi:A/G-specific adenine glycosylase